MKDLFTDNDKSYLVYRLKDGNGTAQIAYNHGGWAYLLVDVYGTRIWLYVGNWRKIENMIDFERGTLTINTTELQPANLFESEPPYSATWESLDSCVKSGWLIPNSDGSYRQRNPNK
jgi:hypothetical protein